MAALYMSLVYLYGWTQLGVLVWLDAGNSLDVKAAVLLQHPDEPVHVVRQGALIAGARVPDVKAARARDPCPRLAGVTFGHERRNPFNAAARDQVVIEAVLNGDHLGRRRQPAQDRLVVVAFRAQQNDAVRLGPPVRESHELGRQRWLAIQPYAMTAPPVQLLLVGLDEGHVDAASAQPIPPAPTTDTWAAGRSDISVGHHALVT
jgi:hypothetical protein